MFNLFSKHMFTLFSNICLTYCEKVICLTYAQRMFNILKTYIKHMLKFFPVYPLQIYT